MIRRLIVVAAMCGVFAAVAHAQVPQTLGYQGFLADASASALADGAYSVTFRLYDVTIGGTSLWSETQTVSTAKGVLTVALGSSTALTLALDNAITAAKIAGGSAVKSINALTDAIILAAGTNVTITPSGNTLTFSARGSGGLADNEVTSMKIADGAVGTGDIADGAVTSLEIADASVAAADLADGSVTPGKIQDGAVAAVGTGAGQAVKTMNSLTDDVTLAAGSNVTITPSGNTLTIGATVSVGNTGNTLDQAYDQGDAGAGRTITADAGAVDIEGSGGLTVSGDVGVGTASAAARLHVLASTANVTLERSGGNRYSLEVGSDDKLRVDDNTAAKSPLQIEAGAPTNSIYIAADGEIGIGTDAPTAGPPAAQLHVVGTVFAEGNLQNWNGVNGVAITPGGDISVSESPLILRRSGNAEIRIGAGSGDIRVSPASATGAVVVAPTTGNVGIGTASPAMRLDVAGAGNTSATSAFRVYNSIGATMLLARDDGIVSIGASAPTTNRR